MAEDWQRQRYQELAAENKRICEEQIRGIRDQALEEKRSICEHYHYDTFEQRDQEIKTAEHVLLADVWRINGYLNDTKVRAQELRAATKKLADDKAVVELKLSDVNAE